MTIEILKINIQHLILRSQLDFSAYGILLPKKHRTHFSRTKRCWQKVLQTRLLYTFPLKMYQYFKYSNSPLFPFDRCRRVSSGLLISEVQAFLQKPSSIIIILILFCKSKAKTHKIISINRFGITSLLLFFKEHPSHSALLSHLVLSRSNQCFSCGLDQSDCRKLHIQIWLWPALLLLLLLLLVSLSLLLNTISTCLTKKHFCHYFSCRR